jgi:hypothetical protein
MTRFEFESRMFLFLFFFTFSSPGEPCHRFDLDLFWFLVRLLGSIDFHRSSLVRLGFVFVSRSVPADHVPSPLLCLGHCLVRSREECPCAAGCTCGRAHLVSVSSPAKALSDFSCHSMRASVLVRPCRLA